MGLDNLVDDGSGGSSIKKHRNKEWLREKVDQGLTQNEIADEAGVSRGAVRSSLDKYNMSTGGNSTVSVGITMRQVEIIVGNVLGDASLYNRTEDSGRYRHDDVHEEFLTHLIDECPDLFDGCRVKSKDSQDIYYLNSRTCREVKEIYDWMYDDKGEKVFPHMMDLSPTVLKYWYLTDGSLRDGEYPEIACNWLGERYVNLALARLPDSISDHCSIRGPYEREGRKTPDITIALKRGGVEHFFDYIGDCPVDCYSYKWPK